MLRAFLFVVSSLKTWPHTCFTRWAVSRASFDSIPQSGQLQKEKGLISQAF